MNHSQEAQLVEVDKLQFDPNNARIHPDENLLALQHSLQTFGQPEPLVVQKNSMMVVSGNGRLSAMRAIGWQHAWVSFVDWAEDKARAYSLVANRTAEMAKWDLDSMHQQLQHLADSFPMDGLGFDIDETLGAAAEDSDSEDEKPSVDGAKELSKSDFEEFQHKCPRCSFEWDD